jgi:hypothetical protein
LVNKLLLVDISRGAPFHLFDNSCNRFLSGHREQTVNMIGHPIDDSYKAPLISQLI